ncbi:MAG: chaperone protein ClpB [Odoribacter sp.]|nr:chaperone protein ClpB [Odoribacter sp.]
MNQISTGVRYVWFLASGESYYAGFREIEPIHFFLGILKLIDIRNGLPGHFENIRQVEIDEILNELNQPMNVLHRHIPDITLYRRTLRLISTKGNPSENVKEMHRSPASRIIFDLLQKKNVENVPINIPGLLPELIVSDQGQIRESLLSHNINIDQLLKDLQPSVITSLDQTLDAPLFSQFGRNLNVLVREGKINPVIGREKEIIELGRIIMQKTKCNAILIGEAGVGKTAIVEGLATAIVNGNIPGQLKTKTIFEINMAAVVAGTKFRGEFEERLQKIIDEFVQRKDMILFIDEVHTLMGAGASGGAMDASNILKPALARGEIRFIGATTINEYRRYIEKDPALQRRMQTIVVEEPSVQDCFHILKKISQGYQQYYGVIIRENAIQLAIDLSVLHIPDKQLPDKAIDILENACSSKLFPSKFYSDKTGTSSISNEIDEDDIIKVVARASGIPVENLKRNQSDKIVHLDKFLNDRILGQDESIRIVCETIKIAKAGFKESHKPVAVFLFCGPTGVGKTETAKLLADFFSGNQKKLIRFDMSEYMEKHEISKLIGAPPGYIGHEEEGQLIGRMRSNPGAVVLFDEIEKAHPDINNIFLQIFDEGMVTGSHGKKALFNQSIIILTSNLGTNLKIQKPNMPVGFKHDEKSASGPEHSQDTVIMHAVRKHFSPEIINRIQQIVIFKPLEEPVVAKIIDHYIEKINSNLKPKNIRITLTDPAKAYLNEKAYTSEYGARNVSRVIDSLILAQLSKIILVKNVSDKIYLIDTVNGQLEFQEMPPVSNS